MPSILELDEINRFETDTESYEEYFDSVPYLTDKQKSDRVKLAKNIGDSFNQIFNIILLVMAYGYMNWDSIREQMETVTFIAVSAALNDDIPDDVSTHLRAMVTDIADVTQRHSEEPYYLSDERSIGIGENISEQVLNDEDFRKAIESGRTGKEWVSMKDSKVRETHDIADGQTRKITEPFVVGDSLLMFPGDWSLGADAKEIMNCRCGIRYF